MEKESNKESTEKVVHEGKAKMTFPNSNGVFYNPVQVFNRDLSVAAIQVYTDELFPLTVKYKKRKKKESTENKISEGKSDEIAASVDKSVEENPVDSCDPGIILFEGLAASGLRSIRYALEIKGIEQIIANDISSDAVQLMTRNIEENQVEHIIRPSQMDASLVMYQRRQPFSSRFDIIDLDPYGSPAEFLDGAVQSVSDGGMLAVTCTDMAVLCGNHSEACYAKYGSMPLKGKFCHEMALRIILSCIDAHANHYKRYIVPLLSVSADFYIRVFVQVFTSAAEVKRSASKKSLVYHCVGCGSYFFQPVGKRIEDGKTRKYPPGTGPPVGQTCPECGRRLHLGGPIWSEPIHNKDFVQKVLEKVKKCQSSYKTSERLIGVLTVISEELPHPPLFYTLEHLSSVVHCTTPSMVQVRSALIALGYQVSGSHASKTAVKTDAPSNVVWDVVRAWVQKNPVKKKHENSPGQAILSKPCEVEVCFDYKPGANPASRLLKLTRFPENPEADWGPKARARKKPATEELSDKRKKHQGKRKSLKDEEDCKSYQCKRFKKGLCTYGDTCRYSHSLQTDPEPQTSNEGE